MDRLPEPELMLEEAQARAYAAADFDEAHARIMHCFERLLPDKTAPLAVADLGCGDADIAARVAAICPRATITALDGSQAMLRYAAQRIERSRLAGRVRLVEAVLPDAPLPEASFDVVVSNSLLHHLHDPQVMWRSVRRLGRPGALVFIADLSRPPNPGRAAELVERCAAHEAGILKRDFYNSLRAAFTPDEIRRQLDAADLAHFTVETISDRHLIVHGEM